MRRLMLALLLTAVAACAKADPSAAAGLQASDAWSRATPAGAPVAAGFLTLRNPGTRADRLLSVDTPLAERVEIHQSSEVDGMARMRRLQDGLPLPAGASVDLAPGGYHLMLIGPRQALAPGDRFPATLNFEHAPALQVEFEVRTASGEPVDTNAEPHQHH